jgi:hypothetical protein
MYNINTCINRRAPQDQINYIRAVPASYLALNFEYCHKQYQTCKLAGLSNQASLQKLRLLA